MPVGRAAAPGPLWRVSYGAGHPPSSAAALSSLCFHVPSRLCPALPSFSFTVPLILSTARRLKALNLGRKAESELAS